jgi:RNA polymerase-interacting CarD/CdnL/TRCF family regulator
MTANTLKQGMEALAHDSRAAAEDLERFAKDVDRGLRCGDITQIAARVQQLLIRAAQVTATRETAEWYTAERDTGK